MSRNLKVKLFLTISVWVAILLGISSLSPRLISQGSFIGSRNHFDERLPKWLYDGRLPQWIWMWANLDGNHYVSIARDGYYRFEHGFFPLYPWLIRVVHDAVGLQFILSGLLITYVSLWLLIKVFWKLIRIDYPKQNFFPVFVTLISFPSAFFLISVYNDALFLLLALLSFYFARKDRWWLAGLCGYLAALTRITGLALFPALLVEAGLKKKSWYPLLLIPLGTLTYFGYLEIFVGGWRLFFDSMAVWGQSRFIFPLQTLYRYVKIILTHQIFNKTYLVSFLELATTVLSLGLLVAGRKLVRRSYWIYAATVLLLPVSSGTLAGLPRYFFHAFPLILILSQLIWRRRLVAIMVLGIFILIQLMMFGFFSQGQFVS